VASGRGRGRNDSDALMHSGSLRGSQAPRQDGCGGVDTKFDDFIRQHGRAYAFNGQEYLKRKALFEQRVEEAKAHNCRPGKLFWKAGLTSLSDRTIEELAKLRGRKGGKGKEDQPSGSGPRDRLAALESAPAAVADRGEAAQKSPKLPDSFSWSHLQSMKEVFDQGGCGSCWASATTVMLRSHTDIYQHHHNFSVQQLVSCVPNPQECGGAGGCNGSTGELALDYVMHNGLGTDLVYRDSDYPCPQIMVAKNIFPMPQPNRSSFLAMQRREPEASSLSPASGFGMVGWSRLPVNKLEPLFRALYQEGPVAVSIVAGYAWNAYISGIMNNCSAQDTVVNHLVVLTGYGRDTDVDAKYWELQNSWGTEWGEHGKMRMIRQDDAKEEAFCGMDNEPLVGTGCKGGPPQVWVCGSCGILFDSVVAHFHGTTPSALEMMQRRGVP